MSVSQYDVACFQVSQHERATKGGGYVSTYHPEQRRVRSWPRTRLLVISVVLIAIVVAIVLLLTYTGGGSGGGGRGGGGGY